MDRVKELNFPLVNAVVTAVLWAARGQLCRTSANEATRPRQEIAALAVCLASDESSFTTGTAQIIDGGYSN